jgi:hypothetical protein
MSPAIFEQQKHPTKNKKEKCTLVYRGALEMDHGVVH